MDIELARQVIQAGGVIARLMQAEEATAGVGLAVGEVLRWPGVIEPAALDTDALGKILLGLFDTTLEHLVAGREREGETLKGRLLARCAEIAGVVERLRPGLPAIVEAQRKRIRTRLAELGAEIGTELGASLDSGRIEQEMAIYAQKIDVTEELDRLEAHVAEVQRVLEERAPIGRRLDFLMQELNREANTLGSKSVDSTTTTASVDLKVLIEQMREQIQNLE